MSETRYAPPADFSPALPKHVWGPLLWKQLHARPAEAPVLTQEVFWLDGFKDHIPCWYCRQHFIDYAAHHPPDFTSPAAYFMWGWGVHNSVNRKLRRPLLAWDAAKWGIPPYPIPPAFLIKSYGP